eukprot:2486-Prymnesium_polylepis.1
MVQGDIFLWFAIALPLTFAFTTATNAVSWNAVPISVSALCAPPTHAHPMRDRPRSSRTASRHSIKPQHQAYSKPTASPLVHHIAYPRRARTHAQEDEEYVTTWYHSLEQLTLLALIGLEPVIALPNDEAYANDTGAVANYTSNLTDDTSFVGRRLKGGSS